MVEYSTIEPWQVVDENGVVYDLGRLMAYFYALGDPRKARGKRYHLVTLLALVFLAKLSGMDGPSAIADWCQVRREALVELLQRGPDARASRPVRHLPGNGFQDLFHAVALQDGGDPREAS